MKNLINRNVNDVFDEIIRKRRSIRSFKSIVPSKEIIKEIITAGAYAPYGALWCYYEKVDTNILIV